MDQKHRSFKDLNINTSYNSEDDDIVRDFYIPVLSNTDKYDRISAYFTSESLKVTARGISKLIENNGHMRLLVSPNLTKEDIDSINKGYTDLENKTIESLRKEIFDEDRLRNDSIEALGWMIANQLLEIRVVFVFQKDSDGKIIEDISKTSIFHQKIGLFTDFYGNSIAFEGSINETLSGLIGNDESFKVFFDWVPFSNKYYLDCRNQFDKIWEIDNRRISKTVEFPKVLESEWKYMCPEDKKNLRIFIEEEPPINQIDDKYAYSNLWPHQKRAFEQFVINKKIGIIQMATGTGKTRLAISIIKSNYDDGLINCTVILVPTSDLVTQWEEEISSVFDIPKIVGLISIPGADNSKIRYLDPWIKNKQMTIVITKYSNYITLKHNFNKISNNALLICDEVHNLGSDQKIKELTGELINFKFRLGLSATPERFYDETGTSFIINEIGPIVYTYDLKSAIDDDVLCKFRYYPIEYKITEEERSKIHKLMKRSGYNSDSENISDTELWIRISNVYKTSVSKYEPFESFIKEHFNLLDRSIIFVAEMEYGVKILEIILKIQSNFPIKTYYGSEDSGILADFSKNKLKCLLTSKRISEGISISDVKTVVLFATATSDTESLQRIGRCLRKDPNNINKIANVIDFVEKNRMETDSSDKRRFDFLSDLAVNDDDKRCNM